MVDWLQCAGWGGLTIVGAAVTLRLLLKLILDINKLQTRKILRPEKIFQAITLGLDFFGKLACSITTIVVGWQHWG